MVGVLETISAGFSLRLSFFTPLPYTPLQAAHIACPYMSSSNCSICICTLCAIPTSTSSQFTIPQYETHAMVRISSCCPPPPGTETTTPPSSTTQEEQQQKKEPSAKQRKIAHQWRLSVFSKGYDNDDAKHATRSSCAFAFQLKPFHHPQPTDGNQPPSIHNRKTSYSSG